MTFRVPSDFTLLKSRLTSVQRSRSKRQTGKETSQTYGALQRSPSPVCQAGRKVGGVNGEGSFWPNLIFFLLLHLHLQLKDEGFGIQVEPSPVIIRQEGVRPCGGESHKQVGSRWRVERNNARSTRGKGCYSRVTQHHPECWSYSKQSFFLVRNAEFLQRRAATT